MASRLGDVLYWAGCLLAAVFAAGGVALLQTEQAAEKPLLLGIFTVLTLLSWLFGRAARYVLSGPAAPQKRPYHAPLARDEFSELVMRIIKTAATNTSTVEWREFTSDSGGFSILLPDTPKVTARRIGTTTATQTTFLIERGSNAYLVSVIQLEKGAGPKNPDSTYFQKLIKHYVEGSKTSLRSNKMITLVGRPAMEGITDAPEAAHLVDITAVGDRVYLIVYVGPRGEETGAEAHRMRDSFKLLN
jgi:hypothetical protein